MRALNTQQLETLNYVAAALLAASGIHILLSLLELPGIVALQTATFGEILLKIAKITWTAAGVVAGVFVAFQALFLINGRSYRKARIAAVGALVLPLLGVSGSVTAFPLLPVGVVALALLLTPKWKAAFADAWQSDAGTMTAQAE